MGLPFFCSWVSTVSTSPTTSGPVTDGSTMRSSSRPTLTRAAASCAAVVPAGTSVCSASQVSGTYGMSVAPSGGAELQREADVALDHVVHVSDAVAEHQGALDAHAKGEAGVDVRVDPG